MIVKSGQRFTPNYPTFDEATGLYVGALIYDVSSGTPNLLTSSPISLADLGSGDYSGGYVAATGISYLGIAVPFTDSGLTSVDTSRAPWAENFDAFEVDNSLLNFNYGAYDQASNLYLGAKIFDVTTGTPVLVATVAMRHVIYGVYSGQFQGDVGKTYSVQMLVFSNSGLTTVDTSRPMASALFVCRVLGADPGPAIAAAVNVAKPSLIGRLWNQAELLGRIPHVAELRGMLPKNPEMRKALDNRSELRGRPIDTVNEEAHG